MIEFKFYPLVEFTWHRADLNKTIGHYIPGNGYNCTKDPRHDTLRSMCKQWEDEGKIIVVPITGEFKTVQVKK